MHPIDAFGPHLAWIAFAIMMGWVALDILSELLKERHERKGGHQ